MPLFREATPSISQTLLKYHPFKYNSGQQCLLKQVLLSKKKLMPFVYGPHKDGYVRELGIYILKQDRKVLILILYLQAIMQIVSTK